MKMATPYSPQDDLEGVRRQLSSILDAVASGELSIKESIGLQETLMARIEKLENVIQALTTSAPVPAPAPAPPGNSITLPQVLSLASFLSSPSFFRIRFVDNYN